MAWGDVMEVSAVLELVEPMFGEMLTDAELRTVVFHLAPRIDSWNTMIAPRDWWALELQPDDLVETGSAHLRWSICGEKGGSSTLQLDNGPEYMVRALQGDLQDFIAESRFAWGELRGPRDLP